MFLDKISARLVALVARGGGVSAVVVVAVALEFFRLVKDLFVVEVVDVFVVLTFDLALAGSL